MQDEMKELQKRISRFSISVCLFLVARRTRGLITYIWSYLDKPFLKKIFWGRQSVNGWSLQCRSCSLGVNVASNFLWASKPRCLLRELLRHIWSKLIIILHLYRSKLLGSQADTLILRQSWAGLDCSYTKEGRFVSANWNWIFIQFSKSSQSGQMRPQLQLLHVQKKTYKYHCKYLDIDICQGDGTI